MVGYNGFEGEPLLQWTRDVIAARAPIQPVNHVWTIVKTAPDFLNTFRTGIIFLFLMTALTGQALVPFGGDSREGYESNHRIFIAWLKTVVGWHGIYDPTKECGSRKCARRWVLSGPIETTSRI